MTNKLKIRHGALVLVCDGARALILENAGDEEFINLKTKEALDQQDLRTHDLGADSPGRTFASVGGMRSAVEQTDWHDRSEAAFLEHLAKRVDHAVKDGAARDLFVVAPPRALAVLRRAYSHDLKGVLRAEINKDLVKLPVHEIERHLAA
jgi:protein required for attachment to host cells